MNVKEYMKNAEIVIPSQKMRFHCTRCGECCRHVKESVPVDSLDIFRITRYLQGRVKGVSHTDDILMRYVTPVLLHESGYFVFMLNVAGEDDACVFLKYNTCMIHEVKPRACRTFPVEAGPGEHGTMEYMLYKKWTHHFKGPQTTIKRWADRYLSKTDRDFIMEDIQAAVQIVSLMKEIPEEQKERAKVWIMMYLYSNYNLNRSFMEQYRSNVKSLLHALKRLQGEQENEK